MIISPEKKPSWPTLKTFMGLGIAVIVLVIYAYSLRPLGFLVPTAACASVLSYQIKPHILHSLIKILEYLSAFFPFAMLLSHTTDNIS